MALQRAKFHYYKGIDCSSKLAALETENAQIKATLN